MLKEGDIFEYENDQRLLIKNIREIYNEVEVLIFKNYVPFEKALTPDEIYKLKFIKNIMEVK